MLPTWVEDSLGDSEANMPPYVGCYSPVCLGKRRQRAASLYGPPAVCQALCPI